MNDFKWRNCHANFINLSHREDRRIHMNKQLAHHGIRMDRFEAVPWQDAIDAIGKDKANVMYLRTKGAIGCHYSQTEVMRVALEGGKSAWVNEDDLIFCDDIKERLDYIQNFVNKTEWDVIFLGGTWHNEPTWHKSVNGKHTHPDLQMCHCTLNKDWEPTNDPYIVRTYGSFSTHSYIVNVKSIDKVLTMLDKVVSISMGIDWATILMQPKLNCFAFSYGCVKQMDNKSDIGDGITRYSAFKGLGPHWWKQKVF